jgi:hypothetical protein
VAARRRVEGGWLPGHRRRSGASDDVRKRFPGETTGLPGAARPRQPLGSARWSIGYCDGERERASASTMASRAANVDFVALNRYPAGPGIVDSYV